jgi:hypothetical protein
MPCLSGCSCSRDEVPSPIFIEASLAPKLARVIHVRHKREPPSLEARLFGSVRNACRQRTCRAIATVERRTADAVRAAVPPGHRAGRDGTGGAVLASPLQARETGAAPPFETWRTAGGSWMHLCVQNRYRRETVAETNDGAERVSGHLATWPVYVYALLLCLRYKHARRSFESQCASICEASKTLYSSCVAAALEQCCFWRSSSPCAGRYEDTRITHEHTIPSTQQHTPWLIHTSMFSMRLTRQDGSPLGPLRLQSCTHDPKCLTVNGRGTGPASGAPESSCISWSTPSPNSNDLLSQVLGWWIAKR